MDMELYTHYEIYDPLNHALMSSGQDFTLNLKLGDWLILLKLPTFIKDIEKEFGPKKFKKKFLSTTVSPVVVSPIVISPVVVSPVVISPVVVSPVVVSPVVATMRRNKLSDNDEAIIHAFDEFAGKFLDESVNGSLYVKRDCTKESCIWNCVFCGMDISVGFKVRKDGIPTFIRCNIYRHGCPELLKVLKILLVKKFFIHVFNCLTFFIYRT